MPSRSNENQLKKFAQIGKMIMQMSFAFCIHDQRFLQMSFNLLELAEQNHLPKLGKLPC